MRNDRLVIGGVLLAGLAAGLAGPKVLNKARLAASRATGTTYRSGVSNPGVRATADPARGMPA
jgi:hypothetical protein